MDIGIYLYPVLFVILLALYLISRARGSRHEGDPNHEDSGPPKAPGREVEENERKRES